MKRRSIGWAWLYRERFLHTRRRAHFFLSKTLNKGVAKMASAHSAGHTVHVNGVDIYFEVQGTGDSLVLLSGFSGSSQDWKPSLAAWGPDFQIILPDLRGHGRSSIL